MTHPHASVEKPSNRTRLIIRTLYGAILVPAVNYSGANCKHEIREGFAPQCDASCGSSFAGLDGRPVGWIDLLCTFCMTTRTIAVFGLTLSVALAAAAQNVTDALAALAETRDVRAALDAAKTDANIVDDQIRFCEIPAPPFKEERRAGALKLAFEHLGLADVRIDKAGNVLGSRPGVTPRPHLVIAAHLDTVFPEGTNVHVRRDG